MKKMMMLFLFALGFGFIGLSAQTGVPAVTKKVAKQVQKRKNIEGIRILNQPSSNTSQRNGLAVKKSANEAMTTAKIRKVKKSDSLIRNTFNKARLGTPYTLTKKAK